MRQISYYALQRIWSCSPTSLVSRLHVKNAVKAKTGELGAELGTHRRDPDPRKATQRGSPPPHNPPNRLRRCGLNQLVYTWVGDELFKDKDLRTMQMTTRNKQADMHCRQISVLTRAWLRRNTLSHFQIPAH